MSEDGPEPAAAATTPYLPLFLRASGQRAAVVGGGLVAARRVETLARAGALVSVYAPRLDEEEFAPLSERAAPRAVFSACLRPAGRHVVQCEPDHFGLNSLELLPHVKAGSLRVLAVLSERRTPTFPDAPTIAESGIPRL